LSSVYLPTSQIPFDIFCAFLFHRSSLSQLLFSFKFSLFSVYFIFFHLYHFKTLQFPLIVLPFPLTTYNVNDQYHAVPFNHKNVHIRPLFASIVKYLIVSVIQYFFRTFSFSWMYEVQRSYPGINAEPD
jgi:hypothetical protein